MTSLSFRRIARFSAAAAFVVLNAAPSHAWTVSPVGESVVLIESGADYIVEIGCYRPHGRTLSLVIRRAFPPFEEFEQMTSATVVIHSGAATALSWDVALTLTTGRNSGLNGEMEFSKEQLDSLWSSTAIEIVNGTTGRVIFSSATEGGLPGQALFAERCQI